MIVHALNNGLIITLAYFKPAWIDRALGMAAIPWTITLTGIAVFLGGIWLMRSPKAESGLLEKSARSSEG
jgi:sodium transport system permease protein